MVLSFLIGAKPAAAQEQACNPHSRLNGAIAALGFGLTISAPFASPARADVRVTLDPVPVSTADGVGGAGCRFESDTMLLTIDRDGVTPKFIRFCSAYGRAAVKTFADGRGRTYVLLEHAEGRGTDAISNFLTVYLIDTEGPFELTRVPVGWTTSPHTEFRFSYEVRPSTRGGLDLVLRGATVGERNPQYAQCCIPTDTTRVISLDAVK